jgi:ketosteroid isomerase-like protein
MLTEEQARKFAQEWIDAWNAHDIDRILAHYAENIVLVSPAAARLMEDAAGTVRGRQALQDYFKKGLEAFPYLRFDLIDVMWGVSSIILYYNNQKGTKTGEFMELDSNGKVIRAVANYSSHPTRKNY